MAREMRWIGTADSNNLGIRTANKGFMSIEHRKKENILNIYKDGEMNEKFQKIDDLLSVLSDDGRIFIEWLISDTGSYLYFDFAKVIEKTKQFESLDAGLLIEDKNGKNLIDESCYFDESVFDKSKLSDSDILILSPFRSMTRCYTPMGVYEGHILFLGPVPTKEFVDEFKIKYILNCRTKNNDSELTKDGDTKERLFNVGTWKGRKKYTYMPLEASLKDEDEKKKDETIKMDGMAYLDVIVDEIHSSLRSGNIIIHCLAGAHRSPFVTGCYLLKYGDKKLKKTPQEIYKFLKQKRGAVQELGYDKQLKLYKEYLSL